MLGENDLAWLKNPTTLADQVGKSLTARMEEFNTEYHHSLNLTEFRSLYKGIGITRQITTTRVGKKELAHPQIQA